MFLIQYKLLSVHSLNRFIADFTVQNILETGIRRRHVYYIY